MQYLTLIITINVIVIDAIIVIIIAIMFIVHIVINIGNMNNNNDNNDDNNHDNYIIIIIRWTQPRASAEVSDSDLASIASANISIVVEVTCNS